MPPPLTPLVRSAGIYPLPSRCWSTPRVIAEVRVSDVSTSWQHASLATVYNHPTDTGCQGN
eukprot:9472822-Pyramimonas_sp.AAC.3